MFFQIKKICRYTQVVHKVNIYNCKMAQMLGYCCTLNGNVSCDYCTLVFMATRPTPCVSVCPCSSWGPRLRTHQPGHRHVVRTACLVAVFTHTDLLSLQSCLYFCLHKTHNALAAVSACLHTAYERSSLDMRAHTHTGFRVVQRPCWHALREWAGTYRQWRTGLQCFG